MLCFDASGFSIVACLLGVWGLLLGQRRQLHVLAFVCRYALKATKRDSWSLVGERTSANTSSLKKENRSLEPGPLATRLLSHPFTCHWVVLKALPTLLGELLPLC
mmetsp:Transcript_19047/g.33898  ORF Transcript_19047/g.33898 Transcript_19047/m.33898 type:complete len:105 (+) Transcript_19047:746-1060(+)